jgi:hypothetical protein
MEEETLYILYSTFFMWFLSWTLIESVMNYYKVQPLSKIKIVLIALSVAIINYIYMTDTRDDNE